MPDDTDDAEDEPPRTQMIGIGDLVDVLADGELEVEGRMPWASNGTYLVRVTAGDLEVGGVYKPLRGERPLWDFPPGLFKREVAAFELSDELGWNCIPPTVQRDGPMGEGSVQFLVDADYEQHHFTLVEDEDHHDQLRTMCVFDILANNTDRKAGHCLIDPSGHIWGIDNGLCFAVDFKLRTVIWEFSGEPIPPSLLAGAQRVADGELVDRLASYLLPDELVAMQRRASMLTKAGTFPRDDTGHRYPWPLV